MTEHATTDRRDPVRKLRDPAVAALTLAEAAQVLGVAHSTVHKAHRDTGHVTEGVPTFRVGRRVMVPAQALRDRLGIIADRPDYLDWF